MYADDLVLISPSSAGLSQLSHECEKFGTRHDLKYNAKKSAVMIYRSMTLKGCTIPNFKLNGIILHVVASYKYHGHYITVDLSDDDDINGQRRTLFVQGNIILRKFNMCSLGVKLTLFRSYCSPMYIYTQHNSGGTTKNLPLLNYKFLIITFFKCFLACPNMKSPATYAHFLTFNAASWFMGLCAGLTVLLIILYRV